MVNVFTVSSYTADGAGDQEEVTHMRNIEDRRFAERSGLITHNLNQPDCLLRGWPPFCAERIREEVERIRPLLRQALCDAAEAGTRPLLFCPMGIGGHRDHLIARDSVLSEHACLTSEYRIVFYEDLHYASDHLSRGLGIRNFLEAASMLHLTRRYRFAVGAEKAALLQCYQSQLHTDPHDLAAFTPSDHSGEPHEAVWASDIVPELEAMNRSSA